MNGGGYGYVGYVDRDVHMYVLLNKQISKCSRLNSTRLERVMLDTNNNITTQEKKKLGKTDGIVAGKAEEIDQEIQIPKMKNLEDPGTLDVGI